VDNREFEARLAEGAKALGLSLPEHVGTGLWRLKDELLRWNARVNLTAITAPEEVLEKHFLDSLAVLPEVAGAASLLDLGAGAGFPGLPLKLALPDLDVTLVDAVAKKVGFLKQAIATLGLAPKARALHVRAGGRPEAEGLPRVEVVISRALMEFGAWAQLGQAYLVPGGRLVAMLGQPLPREEAERLATASGLVLRDAREYRLPFSGASRQVLVATRAEG
jgi:16S rRNA (guanine527-N7)-methyltransferase